VCTFEQTRDSGFFCLFEPNTTLRRSRRLRDFLSGDTLKNELRDQQTPFLKQQFTEDRCPQEED
jgi:hypothetical protein